MGEGEKEEEGNEEKEAGISSLPLLLFLLGLLFLRPHPSPLQDEMPRMIHLRKLKVAAWLVLSEKVPTSHPVRMVLK